MEAQGEHSDFHIQRSRALKLAAEHPYTNRGASELTQEDRTQRTTPTINGASFIKPIQLNT